MKQNYLACDLGAESGRVMLGSLENGKLTLEEIHRFSSAIIHDQSGMHWDVGVIFDELNKGITKACARDLTISSLSVDSWGVDYVLLNQEGEMLSLPFHYRDARTDSVFHNVRNELGDETIFSATGIQFMPFNTLYQLVAEKTNNPDRLAEASAFLTIGDYFNFKFSGTIAIDQSLASTTQLYDPTTRAWSDKLIALADLPRNIFPNIVPPGTVLGPLVVDAVKSSIQVVATCSHDTGAAVAAVPAKSGNDWAYLSSGTWSLLGVELDTPLISETVREMNFTNEAGYHGTTRFLKNIVGLWILQECRRDWEKRGTSYDYAWLNEQADLAEPLRSLINPSDARFMKPDQMLEKIVSFCRETDQPVPETPGQFTRCILESLALLYRRALADIETLTGRTLCKVHVVGGGSQSTLLNQLTADATGRTVIAGPVEATTIGNVMIQAITLGHVDSLATARSIIAESFSVVTYQPQSPEQWEKVSHYFSTNKK